MVSKLNIYYLEIPKLIFTTLGLFQVVVKEWQKNKILTKVKG